MANQPVESKVKAGAAGAPLGVAVGGFACWLIDAYVHTPGTDGDLPGAVTLLVMSATAAGVAYAAGWLAKHTPRALAVGNNITVNVPKDPAATGQQIVEALREYEKRNGPGWRQ